MSKLEDVLVCPLSKQPMIAAGDDWEAPSGLRWRGGDFRVPLDFSHEWAEGQEEFEAFDESWLLRGSAAAGGWQLVDDETSEIYEQMPLEGHVLDVAGHLGTLVRQAGIRPEDYVSVDTMRIDFAEVAQRFPSFGEHYAVARNVCRIQANAEFLPIRDQLFDTVHMRSCLDHFAAPRVALLEAFRVLRSGGTLVIGLSLEGAYKLGADSFAAPVEAVGLQKVKAAVVGVLKRNPAAFQKALAIRSKIFGGAHDHHIFHPTRENLIEMTAAAGFRFDRETWQPGYHNVLYLRLRKP